ncbi:YbdD/YjiX family protein [Methylocystis parvus]|uniref:YbdD/YjiX family protein n=1 Tax=Methylocystis parvus TaxID=134 RepID=A0A6B8M472_9HYPH|nr:YbdD/YjiX family protein [Methylocystis parvus]QGM97155.1 YbdD/YjiX family protein [Methylocystis parvus]WBJ98940.1 YbdD/YjiX family protein [Methylocystis parvus OBBP]
MNCCLPGLDLAKLATKLRDGARLMVGQGDYDAYVAHRRATHDGQEIMTREEFFRARENARFGAGGERAFRCC